MHLGRTENIIPFWSDELQKWYLNLGSSAAGISAEEADRRLKAQGSPKRQSTFQKDIRLFLSQFRNPLMLLLIGAVILSSLLGDKSDVLIIALILLLSGIISFFQERNAGRVVEKLQKLIRIKAAVIREDREIEIPAAELVPGDIILFNAGDIVPADCLLIDANELHVNEASLTGESFPVRKSTGILDKSCELANRTNCLWQGTNVVSGSGKALVIHTRNDTIFGRLIKSSASGSETSFEKGLKDFGFLLMRITLILCLFILVINLANHKGLIQSALFALALAVGMAPELLPAITTIAMSAGAKRLLNKKVIVRKLNSIQNLGEVNLLCTDKTGTITEGAISVESVVDGWGRPSDFAADLAYWNATLETGYPNPLDLALRELRPPGTRLPDKAGEIPYDFVRKRLSIAVTTEEGILLISKGAVSQCLAVCDRVRLPDGREEALAPHEEVINRHFEQCGREGKRAIAVCYTYISSESPGPADEKDMVLAGLVLINDPVKTGVLEAIEGLRRISIDLKIITGDNQVIARSIGQQIGIADPVVITGKELLEISPEALPQRVKAAHIFSEVEPQQKERIILALKKSYTVAYMGDGINDVPAIHAADVGITVDNAVDVAREAADFILLEKDLMVIGEGIREGRKTFANTLKYIYINTGSTFGNMCSVALGSLFLPFLPMLPKQILLTNFLTSFPFLSIPSDNVDEEQTLRPGKWDLKRIKYYMLVFGVHSSLFDLITFYTLLKYLQLGEPGFQTGWFIESIFTQMLIFFIIRSRKKFFQSRPAGLISITSLICLSLTLLLPFTGLAPDFGLVRLSAGQLGLMMAIVMAYVLTADMLKFWFFRRFVATPAD